MAGPDDPQGRPPEDEERTVLELGSSVDGAAHARDAVRSHLTGVPEEHIDTAILLTDELVANVLLHVGTPSRLVIVRAPGLVRVEVSDHSPLEPARRTRRSDRLTGRGLQLLDDLATEWGSSANGGGKTVWFSLALPAPG